MLWKEVAELKRIAICDDEIGTCSDLEKMVLDFSDRRALKIETEVFYSGEAFYRSIQEQCLYDLVFLDIQLLELDGVQVGRQIREQFIRLSEANKNEFYYHAGKSVCRLYLDEIHYFACNGRKVEIYTGLGQKEFYGAMREVWEQVEGKGFWIIHKSYIVNTAFVSVYHYDSVQMTDGMRLPISQKYRKAMKENLTERYQRG